MAGLQDKNVLNEKLKTMLPFKTHMERVPPESGVKYWCESSYYFLSVAIGDV